VEGAAQDGLAVGSAWPTEADRLDPRGASLADGLQALADSLDIHGHAYVGVRWLAAMEMWLRAVSARLPVELHDVSSRVTELTQFIELEWRRALSSGGNHSLCSAVWSQRASVLQEALRSVAARWQGSCRDATCRALSLLQSLALSNSDPASGSLQPSGLGLLEAFWGLLKADPSGWVTTSLGGEVIADQLAEVVPAGRYGIDQLTSAGTPPSGTQMALVLWRLYDIASARTALECVATAGAMPDLRWPPSSLCPGCWRKCFRKGRFCLEPWEDQRRALGAELPEGFADAQPNEDALLAFMSARYSWTSASSAL